MQTVPDYMYSMQMVLHVQCQTNLLQDMATTAVECHKQDNISMELLLLPTHHTVYAYQKMDVFSFRRSLQMDKCSGKLTH